MDSNKANVTLLIMLLRRHVCQIYWIIRSMFFYYWLKLRTHLIIYDYKTLILRMNYVQWSCKYYAMICILLWTLNYFEIINMKCKFHNVFSFMPIQELIILEIVQACYKNQSYMDEVKTRALTSSSRINLFKRNWHITSNAWSWLLSSSRVCMKTLKIARVN